MISICLALQICCNFWKLPNNHVNTTVLILQMKKQSCQDIQNLSLSASDRESIFKNWITFGFKGQQTCSTQFLLIKIHLKMFPYHGQATEPKN